MYPTNVLSLEEQQERNTLCDLGYIMANDEYIYIHLSTTVTTVKFLYK